MNLNLRNADNPLVSIIVPCYNYAHFLSETLSNILATSYPYWECIIVNDGSTDDSETIAKSYINKDNRFIYVYQQNKGLSSARNLGILKSSGIYCQFLDADDKIHPDKIKLQLEIFKTQSETDIVYGDACFFHTLKPDDYLTARGKNANSHSYLNGSGKGTKMIKKFCVNNFFPVSAPLIKKTVFERIGYFDEFYKTYEDWQFWFRCAVKNCIFLYNPQHGTETYIRYGHQSMMTNKSKMLSAGIQIRKFMNPYLPTISKFYNAYRIGKLLIRKILA